MDTWVWVRATEDRSCDAQRCGAVIRAGEDYWLNTVTLRRLCAAGVRRESEYASLSARYRTRQRLETDSAE